MKKRVKLVQSPFSPALELMDVLMIKLHAPYSDEMVTIQVNPNLTHYQESNQDDTARQLSMTESIDDTAVLSFDMRGDREHDVTIDGKKFTIILVSIGSENIEGQTFKAYDFDVVWEE